MEAQELSLTTICKGALPEIFHHELQKVLNNMADINTHPTKPRKIQIEITFAPFADRSGASTAISCKAVIASLDASGATGSIYLAKREGRYAAFSRDLRQEMLFSGEEQVIAPDGKTAGAGDGKTSGGVIG